MKDRPPIACDRNCKRGTCHDYIPEANCYVFWCEVTQTGGIMDFNEPKPFWRMYSPIERQVWIDNIARGLHYVLSQFKNSELKH